MTKPKYNHHLVFI